MLQKEENVSMRMKLGVCAPRPSCWFNIIMECFNAVFLTGGKRYNKKNLLALEIIKQHFEISWNGLVTQHICEVNILRIKCVQ